MTKLIVMPNKKCFNLIIWTSELSFCCSNVELKWLVIHSRYWYSSFECHSMNEFHLSEIPFWIIFTSDKNHSSSFPYFTLHSPLKSYIYLVCSHWHCGEKMENVDNSLIILFFSKLHLFLEILKKILSNQEKP